MCRVTKTVVGGLTLVFTALTPPAANAACGTEATSIAYDPDRLYRQGLALYEAGRIEDGECMIKAAISHAVYQFTNGPDLTDCGVADAIRQIRRYRLVLAQILKNKA